MKRLFGYILLLLTAATASAQTTGINGEVWTDLDGNPINAHGGGVLYHDGTYYWYGEYKGDLTYRSPNVGWECYRTDFTGVSCYSSKNLSDWKFEGLVLQPDFSSIYSDLHPTMVVERPKVVYNEATGKFVMWMHIDNYNYTKASAGVAVADSPTGPFTFIRAYRPNGAESRDITLYKDDDGKAYIFYSSEGNSTMYISLLTDDYLDQSGVYTRNFVGFSREAPAVFKHDNKYYVISSGCSGWSPNEAEYAVAETIMGPYHRCDNPCRGAYAPQTFFAQSTFVLPVIGQNGSYIAMFDRWNKENLVDSRYVWLPVEFNSEERLTIPWRDCWQDLRLASTNGPQSGIQTTKNENK